ncbi:MAG: zinc ribbon domain-containing protein [bacterium]|nr:zinc ribbon domain-containing protein [bacterium]
MAFCPNCRYEYLPEVQECPDCGAALVTELPEIKVDYKDVKWVALPALSGVVYAKMVADVLDQHEIPNYIQSLFGSGGLGIISGAGLAGASARIFVPENRLKEAAEIQNEIMPDA